MKKLTSFLFVLIILSLFGFSSNTPKKSEDESLSERVDSVLSLMSLEDKIGQLNQLSFGIGWGPTIKVAVPDEYKELIRQGKVGSFLNAVEQSSLMNFKKLRLMNLI